MQKEHPAQNETEMNANNHNNFSNHCASILLRMKQSNHNDCSKQCAVLSDIEHATFLLSLMQLQVLKSCW